MNALASPGDTRFDETARHLLLFAATIAGDRLVTVEHLLCAFDASVAKAPDNARLNVDQSLRRLIQRASHIAIADEAPAVSRAHLYEAFVQAARAAGLDPNWLRFAHWQARRLYPGAPASRSDGEAAMVTEQILKEQTE